MTNKKELKRLLPVSDVDQTPEECQDSNMWEKYSYTPMVTLFPTMEQWFDYIQEMINELNTDNKQGWQNFVVNYDRIYGNPTTIFFTSGNATSDESINNSTSTFRYFHHEFKRFKPQF